MFKQSQVMVRVLNERVRELSREFLRDERGEFVGTIGWMAIVSVILVLTHGLIKGWLPTFIQNIFNRMETLV